MRVLLFLLTAVLLLPNPARAAIELSLEENKVQRGNIGFIDMQRVFKLYPETSRAKENFNEVIRQAEEQINMKKAEILRLRLDLPRLRLERGKIKKKIEDALRTPAPAPAPLRAPEPPAVSTAPPAAATTPTPPAAPPEVSTAPTALSSLPGLSDDILTKEDLPKELVGKKQMVIKRTIVGAPSAPAVTAPASGPEADIIALQKSLKEAKSNLADTVSRIETLTTILHEHEASAEKSLMDLESRKTELLLGSIHKAIREVAAREGVSVVIDKAGILYGNNAVDLTERVLNRLKGLRP